MTPPKIPPLVGNVVTWFRKADLLVLVGLLVTVVAVLIFIALADEVMEADTQRVDERIVLSLRNPEDLADPIGPRWVEEAARDLTALGGVVVLVLLTTGVTGLLLSTRKYHEMWIVLVATGGGLLLSTLLKGIVDRPRPSVVPHLSYVLSPSFPSGHSMLSAVVYLTLGALLTQFVRGRMLKFYFLGWAILLTFLVGLSRVYLGVHYLTDVLAGWSVGLAWAIICWLAARYLRQRGTIKEVDA